MTGLRVVVIGCGFFGRYHCHAWRELGVEIAGVCDADPTRAYARAAEFAIPRWSADAGDLLDRLRPDVVDIATGVASHRVLVDLCADRRLAAICQKPFATSLAEAVAMMARMREAGVTLTIHENFRFQRAMRVVAARLRSGELGDPVFGRISFRSGFDVFRAQPYLAQEERFIISDLGVHLLDLARCFLGEVASLACVTRRVNPAIRGEDVATILLHHRSGASCVVDCSYAAAVEEDLFPQTLVQVECARGSIRVDAHFRVVTIRGGRVEHEDAAPAVRAWSEPPGTAVQDSVVALQRHWLECHGAGIAAETAAEDNLRTLALVEAAYAAAASGTTVTPEIA